MLQRQGLFTTNRDDRLRRDSRPAAPAAAFAPPPAEPVRQSEPARAEGPLREAIKLAYPPPGAVPPGCLAQAAPRRVNDGAQRRHPAVALQLPGAVGPRRAWIAGDG